MEEMDKYADIDKYTEERINKLSIDVNARNNVKDGELICEAAMAESLIKIVGVLVKIERKVGMLKEI